VRRRIVSEERFSKLLRRPCRYRMFRDRYVYDTPALVGEHYETK
jgi:hypothetical protein